MSENCRGEHHYYAAETGLDAKGRVVVILICTACGNPLKHEFEVDAGVQLKSQTIKS